MATEYTQLTKHDPKACFICLGLMWNGTEWVPDPRRPETRQRKVTKGD